VNVYAQVAIPRHEATALAFAPHSRQIGGICSAKKFHDIFRSVSSKKLLFVKIKYFSLIYILTSIPKTYQQHPFK